MVNCMPVFIAREPYWQKRFEEAGVPIIGDDIKSQVGATITHRVLTTLFGDRGVHLDRTMQLNVGGNSDFLNMLERERLESKKISKTNAVTSMLDYDIGDENVHVGPSDYVPWLTDRKWAYIRMEGSSFGDVPLNVELKLEVWDSPNSAGIVIDAVRLAKLALNNGISGALEAPSAYLMKSPPKQIRDDESRELIERFIAKNAAQAAEGGREGVSRGRLSRIFWIGAAAILVVAALVALAAVVPRRLLRHRRPHPRHAGSRSSTPAGPRSPASRSSIAAARGRSAGSSPRPRRSVSRRRLGDLVVRVRRRRTSSASKLAWSSVLVLLAAPFVDGAAPRTSCGSRSARLGCRQPGGTRRQRLARGHLGRARRDAFVKARRASSGYSPALAYFLVPMLQRLTSAGQETSSRALGELDGIEFVATRSPDGIEPRLAAASGSRCAARLLRRGAESSATRPMRPCIGLADPAKVQVVTCGA